MLLRGRQRSQLQKSQSISNLQQINNLDKENVIPFESQATSGSVSVYAAAKIQIQRERARGNNYQQQYTNEHRRFQRANASKATLRAEAVTTRKALSETEHKLAQALDKESTALRHKNALHMHANRAINYKKTVADMPKAHNLKSKGVFKDTSREMVRDLVVCGVPLRNIDSVIQTVSHGVGVDLRDSIDKHSVSRIVREGGLAAEMQLVQEIHHAGR